MYHPNTHNITITQCIIRDKIKNTVNAYDTWYDNNTVRFILYVILL